MSFHTFCPAIQIVLSVDNATRLQVFSKFQQNITLFVPKPLLKTLNKIGSRTDVQELY